MELIMLGTGHATATKCYNTCFVIHDGTECFLVDAGGGNGIFNQLDAAGVDCATIRHLFVTHRHTDHLLGVVWMVRKIAMLMLGDTYQGDFTIYCHAELAEALQTICSLTLAGGYMRLVGTRIVLRVVDDGEQAAFLGMGLTFFDTGSSKDKQYGFSACLPTGRRLVCLGDEPYNPVARQYVEGCDWLLAEAFCLYEDREMFRPYEKHHSTARDAAAIAASLRVKNLILYHTEDTRLSDRKERYTAEAGTVFSGNIFVPDDLERIGL